MKLFTYTLLVALLPLLIISFVLYRNTTSVLQHELRTANEIYLRQSVDAMEMIIKQIGASFQQTVLSGAIKEFETFPLGSYYEGLTGDYKEDDLRIMYTYLSSKSNAQWYLKNLLKSNEFIQSVYFFDQGKQMVLTGSEWFTFADFYDSTWGLSTADFLTYPLISEVRSARQKDGSFLSVLPVIYMSSTMDNYIVINLDAEKIYSTIFRKFIRDDEHAFFVLSAGGKLMFHDRDHPISEAMSADERFRLKLTEFDEKSFETEWLGKQRLVTNMGSELLGWTFVNVIAIDTIYGSVTNIKNLIMLTMALLVAATGVLVFLTARNIYDPIRHLLAYVASNSRGDLAGLAFPRRARGELGMIRSSLEEAYEQQASLQIRLKESLPAYKKMYVHSLLHPNRFSLEEIEERLRFLGIVLPPHDLALLVIAFHRDGAGSGEADVEQSKLNKLRIEDMIESSVPEDCERIVMELIEDRFIVIMNCRDGQMTDAFSLAEQIVRHVRHAFDIHCTIGIGNYCESATELQRAYAEAIEAQRHRVLSGDNDIIFIQDVTLTNVPLLDYPKDKETALNSFMLNGETGRAQEMFAEFVKDLRKQQDRVGFQQIQQAFVRLLCSLSETAHGLRLDIETMLRRNRNLYEALLEKNSLKEIVDWFEWIIIDFTAYIGHAYAEKNNKYVKQAIRLMEKQYCDNISLTSVAEQLQLSPSYFSRIFKENTGQSFSDYIMTARIESGKRMLVESQALIKEIGERLGYHKTNYFIKVFKESTGLTPGEYRRMHGMDDMAPE